MTRGCSRTRLARTSRVLSRLAENLYWMARYTERAENTARLLDVNYHALAEAPYLSKGLLTEQWAPLLSITGDVESFREHFDKADRNTVPAWLTQHPDNPGSIRSSLTRARENARTVRDRISTEMWEALNRAYLTIGAGAKDETESLHDFCGAVREATASPRATACWRAGRAAVRRSCGGAPSARCSPV